MLSTVDDNPRRTLSVKKILKLNHRRQIVIKVL